MKLKFELSFAIHSGTSYFSPLNLWQLSRQHTFSFVLGIEQIGGLQPHEGFKIYQNKDAETFSFFGTTGTFTPIIGLDQFTLKRF